MTTMTVALIAAAGAPAAASPSNVRLDVFAAASCADQTTCDGESLDDAAAARSVLRLRVRASDPFKMRRVRVEARPEGTKKWFCVVERDVRDEGTSVDEWFEWDSRTWPAPETAPEDSKCTHTLPHIHGTPTDNGAYEIRSTAINFVDDQDVASSTPRRITLKNPAAAPSWAADPSVASGRNVALAWAPGAEKDLVSYRIERTGPDGRVVRQIDATEPERDGCSKLADAEIRCGDELPPAAGTFTYRIVAMRPGGAAACLDRRCIPGSPSEPRSVRIDASGQVSTPTPASDEPAPADSPPPPAASSSASASKSPASPTPAFDDDPLATSSDTDDGASPLPLILLGVVLVGGTAAYAVRRARRRPL